MKALVICVLCLLWPASALLAQRVSMDTKPLTASAAAPAQVNWKVLKATGILLQVVDAAGTPVRTLDAGAMAIGAFTATFDGRDADGKALPAGEYTLRLSAAPVAKADLTFGAGGFLGRVTQIESFTGTRKFTLQAKDFDLSTVLVFVNRERWDRVATFAGPGKTFIASGDGTIELNAGAEIPANAEVRLSYARVLMLENPWTLRTAPDGSLYIGDNVYLADGLRGIKRGRPGAIFKVDPTGKPITNFGQGGALVCTVKDVDVDAKGRLFVAVQDHAIVVYSDRGKLLYKVAGWSDPNGKGKELAYRGGYWPAAIALNGAGTLAIANVDRTTVLYDAAKAAFDGFLALQTVKEGADYLPVMGRYYGPCLAARGDVLYYTTARNNLVKFRFDSTAKTFATVWATPKLQAATVKYNRPADLWQAMGIALDGSGLIYVADRANHRVQIFFDAGTTVKHVASLGSEGMAVDGCGVMAPHALAISPDRKCLYVADDGITIEHGIAPVTTGLGRVVKWKLAAEETIEAKVTVK